ncbi:C6 zinc finger domain protein [Akanthomyces lecanii RCEF 1005]|uniref:C6 zinc finger domain protein n=1 Tax=Akanthomyces lecanii RCEF 1005 TaxID=1081108 RepID=A0A168DND3_CORDF|nr:C6 zinc finger domain protein [Akanthomyces lecanii RCEF 1005]
MPVQAPIDDLDIASQRQKRWTPRVRTGCYTCRSRRIKCDEAQPTCKRCRIRGLKCDYPLRPQHRPQEKLSLSVPQPPEWAFAEALRYYLTVILQPRTGETPKVPAPEEHMKNYRPDMHISRQESIPSFVMLVINTHITHISQANSVRKVPGSWPAINHLWRLFFNYMAKAIQHLNRCIATDFPPRYNLFRIVDLLSIELDMIDSTFWQAHCRGFLALVEVYGGVDAVIKSANNPSPVLALQFVFMHGLINNTASPVDDQISEFDNFKEADILRIYCDMYFRVFPCPSFLFLAIVRITRLRVLAATLGSESPELLSVAKHISDEVYEFMPDRWTETYKLPFDPKIYTFARVFKATTILYALLSLPQNLAQPFCRAEFANGRDPRLHYRDVLATAITKASTVQFGMAGMCWPLAVLGVSLYDGTPEEQAGVIGWLKDMEKVPTVASGPVTLQQMLPEFWASGKRGWEDCFYKLSQVAANTEIIVL